MAANQQPAAAADTYPSQQQYPPSGYTSLQMGLRAAIELNVFNILAKSRTSQLSAAQIASKIVPATNVPRAAAYLNRILRFLTVHSFLTTSFPPGSTNEEDRLYGLTPLTANMLVQMDDVDTVPLVSSFLLLNTEMEVLEGFHRIKDLVLNNDDDKACSFERVHGVTMYEYIAQRPGSRLAKLFDQSMSRSTTAFFDNVLSAYGRAFDGVVQLLDVGGNTGAALERIVSVWPNVKGINFDLPHVISIAPPIKGVEHVAGDMFESLPNSQAILLKWVLHNWSDEQCVKLLRNCWRALPEEGGKVIVLEFVIPRDLESNRETKDAVSLDFIMLALYGGKERTAMEFQDLASAAGFYSVNNVVPVGGGIHVLEFFK